MTSVFVPQMNSRRVCNSCLWLLSKLSLPHRWCISRCSSQRVPGADSRVCICPDCGACTGALLAALHPAGQYGGELEAELSNVLDCMSQLTVSGKWHCYLE